MRCAPIVAAAALFSLAVTSTALAHPGHDHPEPNKARGTVYSGLVKDEARCGHGQFRISHTLSCTHGPDLAPPKVQDVRTYKKATTASAEARETGRRYKTAPTIAGTTSVPTDGSGAIVCDGDGVTGKRVQVLYVVPADRSDRFATLEPTLGQYTKNADGQLNASARKLGASRHFRFVTKASAAGGCDLDIRKVAISTTDDDTFSATISAVKAQGFNRADRKYLMFVESNVYCGIGSLYKDSRPGQDNANNGYYAQYSRVDPQCWNYAEGHELMHNLGGVQADAPNATPGLHCTDESDIMCYDDDGSGPVVMRSVCTSANEQLFDCNNDDYFNAGTPAPGSYLDTHWNTANSAFLLKPGVILDTTPPVAPTGLTAQPGDTRVTLAWVKSTSADAVGTRVFRNGVQIADLTGTSLVDTGLVNGTAYTYTIRAVDSSGNLSADSAAVTVTPVASTPAGPVAKDETLTGKFSKSVKSVSVARALAAGDATTTFRGFTVNKGKQVPATITVTLKNAAGQTVFAQTSSGQVVVSPGLAAGNYTWTVTGASGVSYSLRLQYLA